MRSIALTALGSFILLQMRYPNFKFLTEYGRAVVSRDHRQTHPPWHFQNVPSLIEGIKEYIDNNQNPQVFVWTTPMAQILSNVAKYKEAFDALR